MSQSKRFNGISRITLVVLLGIGLLLIGDVARAEQKSIALPLAEWRGESSEISGADGKFKCTLGYPEKQRSVLSYAAENDLPAGVYLLRLKLRSSHVCDEVAWASGLKVSANERAIGDLHALDFGRANLAEWKTVRLVHADTGPLRLTLVSYTDSETFKRVIVGSKVNNGPQEPDEPGLGDVEITVGLTPAEHQYFALDAAEVVPMSHTGYISEVTVNKVRYSTGETLHGSATVQDVGGKGGKGTLTLYLEHDLNVRDKVKEIPVTLGNAVQKIDFDILLPKRELGYALVAVFTSADGADRSESAEFFNIADNFYRVAIHGAPVTWGMTGQSAERTRKMFIDSRKKYQNCGEMFAWAEEDMVGMSPDTDWWFSGQTCYHMSKDGLKKLISQAHEQGIAAVTYGKFIMSGYLGWKTAYDYPNDHRGQYWYPVGMWEGVSTVSMDKFMNKEFAPYNFGPGVGKTLFSPTVSWQDFIPINPDPTPRMVRISAEAVMRSIEMFGWDGVRWDGHPRGGGQCGGEGKYDYFAARRTQALVRYFKDIINAKYPNFQHGYNYFFVQNKPDWSWGTEDFELDELCRGGGLLMNESIRNSAGRPFEWIARNIQVEGDLCRERGGYLLSISCDGESERDGLVEAILYFAGGNRPMGKVCDYPLINRYGTRYSCYTFDERLRRLEKPEGVLKPLTETKLWWQPYVYETPLEGGKEQLVVNLLNIPRNATPKSERDPHPKWDMNPGTEPFTMGLNLPQGYTVTGAHFIDPFTLEVTTAEVKNGRVDIPVIDTWSVLVVDLKVVDGTPTLASQYGPPPTFGVKRQNLTIARTEVKPLDISKATVEVNKDMSYLSPKAPVDPNAPKPIDPDTLTGDERTKALLKIREQHPPEESLKGWWKGGSLPSDLKLKEKPPVFSDLTPKRNGRTDIFYGRGALDYRLRMWDIYAGLDRFQVHDAPLGGVLRQSPGMRLYDGISWKEMPDYDLLVYTSIPHCAIGAENSYALVDYVKAGGGVFFTGGEYAFGKGGYSYTVLERELLPVVCVENLDVRYVTDPLPLEAGKDFAELGVKANFAAKPSFYCWNQVALKDSPTIKVFLKSGNRPILVGWQLGKGRVACLLLDHRGKSDDGINMFFDWQDWPALARGVIAWLAPDAGKTSEVKTANAPDYPSLLKTLATDTSTDVSIGGANEDDPEAGLGNDLGLDGQGIFLDEKSLKKRIGILTQLLLGDGKEIGLALAGQSAKIANLPPEIRKGLLDFVRRNPAPGLAEIAAPTINSHSAVIRENGFHLMAIAGDPAFQSVVKSPPAGSVINEVSRNHALATAVACCTSPTLAALGKDKITALNKREAQIKAVYVGGHGGTDFSLAAPEQPCLDTESLYTRIGWLAYMTRQDPVAYGPQFTREWLMIGQYIAYSEQTIGNLWGDKVMSDAQKRAKSKVLNDYADDLRWMSRVTTPTIEKLLKEHPDLLAQGFVNAHFLHEADRAINLLGNYPAKDTKIVLTGLTNAKLPRLADFAKARLKMIP
ncbi:MAG: glutamine amidotransferase [Armatimonadota bacterium]